MKRLFAEVYAPATLGRFLRGFTHGHTSSPRSPGRIDSTSLERMDVTAQALVVVDMQHAFVLGENAVPSADALIAAVSTQLENARSADCMVVHLQNDGGPGTPDEPETCGWELALPVASGEPVLRKTKDDGFEGTVLGEILSNAGVRTLSICGVNSEMCVAATARGALARGPHGDDGPRRARNVPGARACAVRSACPGALGGTCRHA